MGMVRESIASSKNSILGQLAVRWGRPIWHIYIAKLKSANIGNLEFYIPFFWRNQKFETHIILTLPYKVCSSIVIMHEKSGVFCLFVFSEYRKNGWNFLIKKIEQNYCVLVYKKALMSEHQKNYILRDINYFAKMSVTKYCVCSLAQKLVWKRPRKL